MTPQDDPGTFVVNHKPFLVAVGNDVLLSVDRSMAMSTTDPRYQPIKDHITDHHMVLLETKRVNDDPQMYGHCEQSWYATPEARNLLMTDKGSL